MLAERVQSGEGREQRLDGERWYETLYEHIPLMYFTLGVDGTILSVNSHGAAELGYTAAELVGTNVLRVFHEEDRNAVQEQMAACVSDPGPVARWNFRKVRRDGSTLWVREAARAMKSDGRTVVLVVCEDVTDLVETERRLKEHEDQLQSLAAKLSVAEERERRRIATLIHDEIGQMLAMANLELGGVISVLTERDSAVRVAHARELVTRAIASARTLTTELSPPALYELGLRPALQGLGERLIEAQGIAFRFDEDAPPEIQDTDTKALLFRAARELLLNVVKHAQATQVRLRLNEERGVVRIHVEDDGTGFDASDAGDRISLRGGYGLFSLRERLETIGGRLDIRSTGGSGTAVTVEAPLIRKEAPR